MRNPTYLARSRHGVFYFRFPLPALQRIDGKAPDLKISLGTRDPSEALCLSTALRHLGDRLVSSGKLADMRYDEIREVVQTHFAEVLAKHASRVARDGPLTTDDLLSYGWSADHYDQQLKDGVEDEVGYRKDLAHFIARHRLPVVPGDDAYNRLSTEYLRGQRDCLRAMVAQSNALGSYELTPKLSPVDIAPTGDPNQLQTVADLFFVQSKREGQWVKKTEDEKREYLGLLYEVLGPQVDIARVGSREARRVKEALLACPVNRHKNPTTKDLSLTEAINVAGRPTLHIRTINKYLQTYVGLFNWAKDNGYVRENPFSGMGMRTNKLDEGQKKVGFKPEELNAIRSALLSDPKVMAHHKWGALIGMYLGARLNEIAQLDLADIKLVESIWCFDINKDGDRKRLKNAPSKRIVPMHSWLIEHGLLEYVNNVDKRSGRLFPEFSYSESDGYGRNLGRWFNNSLLKTLDIKTKTLTFHTLRHTVVNRLNAAGVSLQYTQAIVGHEPKSTTEKVYSGDGYPMELLKAALEKI